MPFCVGLTTDEELPGGSVGGEVPLVFPALSFIQSKYLDTSVYKPRTSLSAHLNPNDVIP